MHLLKANSINDDEDNQPLHRTRQEMGLFFIPFPGFASFAGWVSVGFTPHTLIYNSLTPSCIIISL